MARTFAVGDIHGCALTLQKLLMEEIKIQKDDEIYLLGDYIDRGPESKKVIDFILALQNNNYKVYTLRGNHEQLFLDAEKSVSAFENWIVNGGVATLESFDVASYNDLDSEYKTFFNNTQFYFDTHDFIFVHAGLNFSNENEFEDTVSMLWIRNMKINKKRLGNKVIIHGHTPTPLREVKKQVAMAHEKGSVNIDTGCCLKNHSGLGVLSALEVTTMQLYSTENID